MIQQTANTVEKIATDVNQKVQVQETIGSILNVFHELGGAGGDDEVKEKLLAPSRRYIRCEEVFFREAPFEADLEPRRLYLFNDLIILATLREMSSNGSKTLKGRASLTRSRGKSLGNIVSNMMKPDNSGNDASEQVPWAYQVTHWIDLANGDVRPLPKPDETGYYGFRIKSVKRTTTEDNTSGANNQGNSSDTKAVLNAKKSLRKITWGAGVKESPPIMNDVAQGRTTRVVTSIHKFEIWMATREKLQTLLSDIEEKIDILGVLHQHSLKGVTKFGASSQKKTRSWIQKKASKEDIGAPGVSRKVTSGSIDAKDALSVLSKKYGRSESKEDESKDDESKTSGAPPSVSN